MGDGRARARTATTAGGRRIDTRARSTGQRTTANHDPRALSTLPTAPELLDLQRSAGNAAVLELVQRAVAVQRADPKVPRWAPWKASKRPVLRRGDGPMSSVGELQQALNSVVPGKPLRITAVFDAETEAKVKEYQRLKDYAIVTGIASKHTWWNLDKDAPRVTRQTSEVVLGAGKGEALGTPDLGTTHPTIKLGSKGPAVEELQQKLNTLTAKDISIYLSTHGKFDKTTRLGVIDFQKSRKPPLKANGVVGKETWAALDAIAGPVKVGRADYEFSQRSEGTVTGSKTVYTWRLLPDRLQVTVNFKFTGASKHPMVAKWVQDIKNLWNSFKFVRAGKPSKELLLDFVIGTGTPVDATVRIHKTPKDAEEPGRSDSTNWYTGDTDPGLAPHEFGHLIGLQDEYNKGPELYSIVTGEQPDVGEVRAPKDHAGNPVAPETIAAEMWKAIGGSAAGRGKRAHDVVDKYGLRQGAFAQRVAVAYEKAHAGKLLREDYKLNVGYQTKKSADATMADDLAARIPGRMTDPHEFWVVKPFLYENRGIMGGMQAMQAPISKHDHPVAERHVRHFLRIVQGNESGSWRTVRR